VPQKNWLSTKFDASLAWAKKTACAVWQSAQSVLAKPAAQALLVRIKQINLGSIKRFVGKYKWPIVAVLILLYAGSKAYTYFFPPAEKGSGPQTITSVIVQPKNVPLVIEATGTIVANSIVDIRPMITNTVSKIFIKDGQEVKQGDLLFLLDDRVDKANYEKLKSLADDAQKQYLRAKELMDKNFISKAGLDTSLANARSAQAAANAAQVQLSFDSIHAPISGRTGIINVFPGSLVQASNTVTTATSSTATTTTGAMVTITQLNPINVQFVISEKDIPVILENQGDATPMQVSVTVGDSAKNSYEGKVLVIDNQVDPAIAAVRVKAQIPNEKGTLLPGEFARIKLNAGELKDALVVPSQAIIISPKGRIVYIVEADDKVASKPITVVYEYAGQSVITGIAPGSRVVVEGKQNLRPGGKIREATPAATSAPAKSAAPPTTPAAAK
jgi:RND family efflux transporter MFP subunit